MNRCAITDCEEVTACDLLCHQHYQNALSAGYVELEERYIPSERIEKHRKYDFGGNYYKALERDKYRCVNCGISNYRHKMLYNGKGLHIHHIDGKGSQIKLSDRNNDVENLITYCWSCHTKADQRRLKEYDGHTIKP